MQSHLGCGPRALPASHLKRSSARPALNAGPRMALHTAAPLLAHGCCCCCMCAGRRAGGARGAGRLSERAQGAGRLSAGKGGRARRSWAGMLGGARGAGRDRAQGAGWRAHGAGQGRARGAVGVAVEFEAGLHPVPVIAEGRWRGRVDTGSGVGAKQMRHRRCRGRRGPAARREAGGSAGTGTRREQPAGLGSSPSHRQVAQDDRCRVAGSCRRARGEGACPGRSGVREPVRLTSSRHRQREQQGLVAKNVVVVVSKRGCGC